MKQLLCLVFETCSLGSLCHCRSVFTSPCLWLFQVGERLARYDVDKRCAIEKEDYDLAKKKKELMEEYRRSVYQQLEVHNLLDMSMVSSQTLIVMFYLYSNKKGKHVVVIGVVAEQNE